MTVVVLAQQADTPVDVVIRELTARGVPVFRADTSWFPRELVLEARLSAEGQWTGRCGPNTERWTLRPFDRSGIVIRARSPSPRA